MTLSGFQLGKRAAAAKKRRAKWIPRVLRYLESAGPMTFEELRQYKKMAHLTSDRWLRDLLDRMERDGQVVWNPAAGGYSLAGVHTGADPSID